VTVSEDRLAQQVVIDRLLAAGCVAADEEAHELIGSGPDHRILQQWVSRREQGEPLAWITGTLRFCGHAIHVDPGVYVPRLQSEELARRAAALLRPTRMRAADLCTGTGAIAAHLMAVAPDAMVVGVDIDIRAVVCARRNGVPAVHGHLGQALRPKSFDVVTAVAPYVPSGELAFLPTDVQRYEPRHALDGGDDGLRVVRQVVVTAAQLLRPGGSLLIELGGEQDRALTPALAAAGFGSAATWFDEDGDLRGLAAQSTDPLSLAGS
jgi:release factor glutamine methyltransferase